MLHTYDLHKGYDIVRYRLMRNPLLKQSRRELLSCLYLLQAQSPYQGHNTVLIQRDAISSVTIALLRQLISWDNGRGRDANPVT